MKIKVLIVEDSIFFQKQLISKIETDPSLEVVGTAGNGAEALEKIAALKPDVITMDVTMPVMDGITAVKKIMENKPIPVLMLSALTEEGARTTFDALDAGAIDFLPKKSEILSRQVLIDKIKTIAKCNFVAKHDKSKVSSLASGVQQKKMAGDVKLVIMGASTGGPVSTQSVIEELPQNFPVPIILVQHMPETFTKPYSVRMNESSKLSVKEAEDGEEIKPGHVFVAPGGKQLGFKKRGSSIKLEILPGSASERYQPSVDFTFDSAAKNLNNGVLAIVLTGMGSDGTEGAKQLKSYGSRVWAQDKETSVIFGMPMSVIKAGLADEVVALNNMSLRLIEELS